MNYGTMPNRPENATAKDCERRLRSCGPRPGKVVIAYAADGRAWNCETDKGPRRVTWKQGEGWKIARPA